MKYEILVIQEIDSSHQLKLPYKSGCNNLHGHRWRVEVCIKSSHLNKQSMVVDFQHIKEIIKEFDHIHMNDKMGTVPATAEQIALQLFNLIYGYLIAGEFGNKDANVKYLTLFETPSGSVTLWPKEKVPRKSSKRTILDTDRQRFN